MADRTADGYVNRSRPRALLLQHAIYPYRKPLFDALGSSLELTVIFCLRAKSFRRWDTSGVTGQIGFRGVVLPHLRIGSLVLNLGLLGELRHGRYDVILLGVIDLITLPQIIVILVYARLTRTPVVVIEEFFVSDWYLRSRPLLARFAIMTRRFVYGHCRSFATWNPRARGFLVSCGIDRSRIFSGYVHYPTWSDETETDSAPTGPPSLIAISYFLPRKGIEVLIRAYRSVPIDSRLVLAGSGELEPRLRREAQGDERIVFAGHLDERAKRRLLEQAHALVLPTLWDPWGAVVNEAFHCGVPVIVTDAAGLADCIDGAGVVVPAGDEFRLARAIERLLDEPGLRDSMGRRAREVVADWTLEAQVKPVVEAVRLALGSA